MPIFGFSPLILANKLKKVVSGEIECALFIFASYVSQLFGGAYLTM